MKPAASLSLWLLCMLGCTRPARAQSATEPLKIQPDTPDFTVGTSIVPRGHVQTESRITAERRGSMHRYGLGETLVRYGLSKRAEVRLGVPSYLISRQNGRRSGADDASIEAKFKLFEGSKSEFGFFVESLLPTGSRRVAQRRYQPSFRLTSSFQLNSKMQLLANVGARRASADQNRFTQFIGAASLRYDATPKTKVYSEIYGFNRLEANQKAQKFLAAGVIQLLNDRTALDVRAGRGLDNETSGPDYFYELGLSHLF